MCFERPSVPGVASAMVSTGRQPPRRWLLDAMYEKGAQPMSGTVTPYQQLIAQFDARTTVRDRSRS